MTRVPILLGLLPGCILVGHPCPHCVELADDCVDVALRDAQGRPDGCDLAACVTCAEACGGSCLVQESYPPTYACDGDGAWNVYDFCPDWSGAGTVPGPRADDVVDLGCGDSSGETLTAVASGPGRISVVHTDYLLGCCPEAVTVDVHAADGVLAVSYTLVDDVCDCACLLDVSYDLADVPPGSWTILAGPSATVAQVVVD